MESEPTIESAQHYLNKRKYRPLDVKSWFEGFLRLIGWILVIVLSVATGAIFMAYELKVLNRHDTDFRDMYFDQRITNDINNRYHKNFVLAEYCCNMDPVYFPYYQSCNESYPYEAYGSDSPYCKPLIIMECADIRSAACNSTREVLYAAVGLSLPSPPGSPPAPSDCLRAGRVRVGAMQVAAGRPVTLVAYWRQQPTGDTLVLQSPFSINSSQVVEFVEGVVAGVAADQVDYVQPSTRLSSSISLAGSPAAAQMSLLHEPVRGVRAPPPYKAISNLWPWPGMNARCQNTAVEQALFLNGTATVVIPRFSLASPDSLSLSLRVATASMQLAAWQVQAAGVGGEEVGAATGVAVSYLSAVQAAIGQVPLLGACGGWQFSPDPHDLTLTYTPFWNGSLADLRAGLAFGPFLQDVNISIVDVASPHEIALPLYGGMWYIFNAFIMAFIWLVSTSLMLFVIILVWWNVRSNKGLPPFIYRYMRKYRGW